MGIRLQTLTDWSVGQLVNWIYWLYLSGICTWEKHSRDFNASSEAVHASAVSVSSPASSISCTLHWQMDCAALQLNQLCRDLWCQRSGLKWNKARQPLQSGPEHLTCTCEGSNKRFEMILSTGTWKEDCFLKGTGFTRQKYHPTAWPWLSMQSMKPEACQPNIWMVRSLINTCLAVQGSGCLLSNTIFLLFCQTN